MQQIIKSIYDMPAFLGARMDSYNQTKRWAKTIVMKGQPGVGKTAMIDSLPSVSKHYDEVITIRPSQHEATDFALPVYDRDNKTVDMVANAILPSKPRQILFIDEFGQANRGMQKVLMQLGNSNERGIGSHYRLPEDTFVVLATNGIEHGSGVEKTLNAMSDRLSEVEVNADLDRWCVWAIQHNIPTQIVAYLRFNSPAFCQFDRSAKVNPNPRNWDYAGTELGLGYDDKDQFLALSGCVGEEQAVNLTAFLSLWGKLPNVDEIARDPNGAQIPEDDGSMGALYAIAGAIANVADKNNFSQFIQYLKRLDKEFEVFSVQTMTDKQKANGQYEDFVKSTAYVNWCVENQDVIL